MPKYNNFELESKKLINQITTGGSVRSKAANINLTLGNNYTYFWIYNNINDSNRSSLNTKNYLNNNNDRFSSLAMSSAGSGSLQSLTPNKSSLLGGNTAGGAVSGNGNSISPSASVFPSPPTKSPLAAVRPHHGKANFAPKPPGLQQLAIANGQRPAVVGHSMKSPRSPAISTSGVGPVFPMQQHFGTMRSTLAQSHDAINAGLRTPPRPPIRRPSVPPPKPPNVKSPPPPTPARSTSNSNLNLYSISRSAPNSCPNCGVNTALATSVTSINSSPLPAQPTSNSSSTHSVSALRDQFQIGGSATPPPPPPRSASRQALSRPLTSNKSPKPIILNGGPINFPPLPPRRTCPGPPTPQRHSSTTNVTGLPPVPPRRYSSIRANAPFTPPRGVNAPPVCGNSTSASPVSRLVVDLESKFGKRFHDVTEFPKPPPFLNVSKTYFRQKVNDRSFEHRM